MSGIPAWELLKLGQGRRRDAGEEIWGILGDANGNPNVPGQPGKSWVRFPAGAGDSGEQLYYPPVAIWEGVGAAFLKKGGRRVEVGLDSMGVPEIKRGNRQDLAQVGITAAVTNALNREGKAPNPANPFIPLTCEPVGTTNSPSMKVTIYPFWYDDGVSLYYYPGTESSASKIDLTSSVPIAGKWRYAVLWLTIGTTTITVTTSTPANITSTSPANASIIAALQECDNTRPANSIPIKAFYLADAQTALKQIARHIDLRQMVNVPAAAGALMSSFTVAGDTGTPQAITNSNTLTIAGGAGIDTVASATDTVTVAVDNTVIRTTGTQAIGAGLTLTAPTIADFTNAQHDHLDADDGGTLSGAAIASGAINNIPVGTTTAAAGYFSALRLLIGGFFGIFTHANTADRTYTLPDVSGTVALTTDFAPASVNTFRISIAPDDNVLSDDTFAEIYVVRWFGNSIMTFADNTTTLAMFHPSAAANITFENVQAISSTTTNGSPNVTVANTKLLSPGMSVTGTGIPVSTTISSITSTTVYVLSANATASGTVSLNYTIPASKNVDIFCYMVANVMTLGVRIWTSDTVRAASLSLMDTAVPYFDASITGYGRWLYLGTVRTDGSSQFVDTVTSRLVWNLYNQRRRPMRVKEDTNSYTYTSASYRQVHADADNQFNVVVGYVDISEIDIRTIARATTSSAPAFTGIGEDSTTVIAAEQVGGFVTNVTSGSGSGQASVRKYVPLGYHFYAWLEYGGTGVTFVGDNGGTLEQTAMEGWILS